ncbi:MAG: response regulator transcription factor [Nitrospina sp.]|jgi:DNA-binding NarL/FixJ family response regulator|nr:response regulator transcription factor [Nitrospina sp.]
MQNISVIKIVLADDHAFLREGIAGYVERKSKDMEVVGQASNWKELMRVLRSNIQCDLALLDIMMPNGDGLNMVKNIRAEFPNIKLLMYSSLPEEEYALRFIKSGASGFISKADSIKNVLRFIRDAVKDKIVLSEKYKQTLAGIRANNSDPISPVENLTDREFQVLVQLGSGKSPSEVAELLHLSPRTVSTHRNNILRKMNWKNNAEMMFYVIKNGMADLN